MLCGYEKAAALLPEKLKAAALAVNAGTRAQAEEIRLRCGREPTLLCAGAEKRFLPGETVSGDEIGYVLERASRASMHAVKDELSRGFISAGGGVRVGVCGTAVFHGSMEGLRDISSLSLRIPSQIRGAGAEIMPQLLQHSVLIVSPPGGGKTTLLREMVRHAGDAGARVSLADERGEIAAVRGGVPQFDVGRCTAVLSLLPKAEAAEMLLRTMNPQIIALDEIASARDAETVIRLANCGVRIFATAHAASADELKKRRTFVPIMEQMVFDCAAVIENREGKRRYELVWL